MKRSMLFFCLFLPLAGWGGPLFHRSTKVMEVSTRYFRILYAASDEKTAYRLAAMADSIYEEWIERLGLTKKYSFLVVMTSDVETMNGMFTSLPRNTIVLYNYIENPLYVPSDDALRLLFTHELLHAISINVKTPMWDFFSMIYGDFLSPQALQQPWWMIEGITVSGESVGGHGRVNSPSHRALLVQHFLERRFEDVSDVVHLRSGKKGYYHYLYGGFFSDYLQKRYGWEKYAQLWKKSAEAFWPYSFDTTFKAVYGVPVEREWEQFATTFVLQVSRPNLSHEVLYTGDSLSLRSQGEDVYIIDGRSERIYRRRGEKWVFAGEGRDIAVWGDVAAFRQTKSREGKPRDGFVLKKGKKQVTFLSRVMDMDIRRESYLAVQAEGLMSRLVLIEGERIEEILPARPTMQYMFPRFVSDDMAVWVVLVSNRPFLGVWERSTGEKRFYDFSGYEITSLSVYGNEVWMVVFPRGENTLGRVARFSLETGKLWVSGLEVFGGFYGVAVMRDALYLVQRFAQRQECIRVDKDLFLTAMEGEVREGTRVALDIPQPEPVLQFVSRSGRRLENCIPGVRVPLIYPHPIALLYLLDIWNYSLWLYHEDPLQENTFFTGITYTAAYYPWLELDGEWENRYFYPFSTFVGGSTVISSKTTNAGGRVGFSYQWDISPRNVVLWRNSVSFFPSESAVDAVYRLSLVWSMSDGAQLSLPYPIFRGPLTLEVAANDEGYYYFYGTAIASYKNFSLGLVGGWGDVNFFSPLNIRAGDISYLVNSALANTMRYQGVLGGHGFVVGSLPVEAGYKHWPIYLDSLGVVLGTYALYLQREGEASDFYALYIQTYSKWIIGYVLPLSYVMETLYTRDEIHVGAGIAVAF